jgi:cation transport regulator ChaB
MPYTKDNPPAATKGLPEHAVAIFIAAFNSALEQYKDESKAFPVAWAAVKTKYNQNEKGEWIAKEAVKAIRTNIAEDADELSCPKCGGDRFEPDGKLLQCCSCGQLVESKKEANMKESDLSADDKRQLLQAALDIKFPSLSRIMPSGVWVNDVFDTELVYRQDGVDYKVSYVIDTEGKVTLGEPVKVKRQTIYTPMESLRRRHAEIIQEIGRRNAAADAGRIKQIMSICQELLSNEPAPEDKVAEALKEADSVIAWLKEQAIEKTEDGVGYPAAAFAYVPDSEMPSTWKVRMWEDPTKKITRAQLGRAAAAFSPGGFRGEKVQIPSEDIAAVKRKIRSAYNSLQVPDEEIPRWVKESESRTLLTGYIPLTEASIDKGIAKITVIKAGFNASKDRFYPLDTLARDHKVFEGLKMYADHPSEADEKNRPERSIRDWVATLKNVHMQNDSVVGEAQIVEPWMQEKLATLRDKKMLPEMGVSINAVGAASEATIEGIKTNYIERIARGRSVDFVTEAGAGGLVEMYEAERDDSIDFVSLTTFKERRPDLVHEIETSVKNKVMKEVRTQMELEDENKTLKESNATLTAENETLKAEKATAEKASRIAGTKALVDKALSEADLPEPAKARILERFKDAEKADGLTEAIETEKIYIAKVTEAGKVRGMGGKGGPDPEADHKALVESWKRLHPEWSDKDIEVAIKGR